MRVSLKPETTPDVGETAWWRWFAASLAPNPRVLLLVIIGWTTELVLLACVRDSIYSVSRWSGSLAAAFAAWFWVTAGWVMWFCATRLRGSLWRVLWIALLVVTVACYGLSWGVYLRTSRFLDWDAVRFAMGNFHLLWMYVRQTEHGALFISIAAGMATAAAIIGGGPWLARGRWLIGDLTELRISRRVTWYSLGLSSLLLLLAGGLSDNLTKRQRQQDVLRNGLHPVVAMASSWVSSSLEEQVLPCLDPSELRPLTQADAWNRSAHVTNRANVILITVESMRHDVVGLRQRGQEVMPIVNALARDGVQFTRAYSTTTHSDYATTALYSSLFPLRTVRHLYFHADDPWPKMLFYDVLKPAGYATAIISSQNERWGNMINFLNTPRLDFLYDPEHSGAPALRELSFDNLPDAQTMDKAISWIAEQRKQGTPFFLGLNLQDSHFPYKLPPEVPRIFQPATVDFPVGFFEYPIEKVEIMRNAYDNALRECDRQIGRLIEALRASGQLSHTIIVLSGDHGEAFREHTYVTHAREPIEPVIRTACVFYAPGLIAPRVDDYPVALIDVLPTTLGLLGLSPHPNFQGIDVLAANRPPREQRLLFFHVEVPVARTDAVLWGGRWKYSHDRLHGMESLFDVESDPAEDSDLTGRRPKLTQSLRQILQTWRRQQLAYYRFPFYYERYFPPSPPATPAIVQ